MKKRSWIVQMMGAILVLLVVAGAIVGVIGALANWQSLQFSNALFIGGALLIVLGTASIIGTYTLRGSFGVQYSQSAGDMTILERAKLWMADLNQGYSLLAICVIAGGLLIGGAVLVDKIFE